MRSPQASRPRVGPAGRKSERLSPPHAESRRTLDASHDSGTGRKAGHVRPQGPFPAMAGTPERPRLCRFAGVGIEQRLKGGFPLLPHGGGEDPAPDALHPRHDLFRIGLADQDEEGGGTGIER